LREASRPKDRGRELADDVDAIVEVVPLVVLDEAVEQIVFDPEDADRLGVMDEPRRDDMAGQVDAHEEDQRAVGETLRLGHVPGREDITQLAATFGDGDRRGSPLDLADLVGSREDRLKNLRREILGDGRT
jgi:hypothetical protein